MVITVHRTLQRPHVRAHLSELYDKIEKELVLSLVYNPFVEILADAASLQRQRKRRL